MKKKKLNYSYFSVGCCDLKNNDFLTGENHGYSKQKS